MSTATFISNNRSSATSRGLAIHQVTWEDTGRYKGSCVGSNISDMTLKSNGTLQPVIRKPNFSDVTADQPLENFKVVVGNESNQTLRQISLSEYIDNLDKYTGNTNIKNMRLPRDNSILTSSQACVLVNPRDTPTNFHVQLYNYQSRSDDPAVLVIMSSAQGTSCQVVSSADTALYFNKNGTATDFGAVRLQDDRASRGVTLVGAPQTVDEKDKNALFIFQIPLKVTRQSGFGYQCCMPMGPSGPGGAQPACGTVPFGIQQECGLIPDGMMQMLQATGASSATFGAQPKSRGMDWAQVSAGNEHGRYTGVRSTSLIRDADLPIRCTVQYYHITDSDTISSSDFDAIEAEINRVYTRSATATGSLVTSTSLRPTEPTLPSYTPSFTSTRASHFL